MDGSPTEIVLVMTVFSMLITKVVDLLRNIVGPVIGPYVPKWTWNAAPLGLGIAMAIAWRINALDNYSDPTSVVQGVFGQVLTGLAMGGTSSGYHELFDVLSSTAKRARYGIGAPPADAVKPVGAENMERKER